MVTTSHLLFYLLLSLKTKTEAHTISSSASDMRVLTVGGVVGELGNTGDEELLLRKSSKDGGGDPGV